jgi:hypothetical protein
MGDDPAGSAQAGNSGAAAAGSGQAGGGAPPAAGGGAASVDFSTYIPADIKDHPSLKSYDLKTPDGLGKVFKSLVSAQSMIGGEKIVVPKGALDNPEVWNKAYEALGRPKDPGEYKFSKDYKPGADPESKEIEAKFRKFAHDSGYNQKQFAELNGFLNSLSGDSQKKMIAAAQARHEKAVESLRKEWGEAYDVNVGLANKVLKAFGGPSVEVKAFLDRYANEPVAIRVLAAIGKRMDESALVAGDKPDFETGPAEAKNKRADIMTNKDNPLHEAWKNKRHPRHQDAMDEVARLSRIVVGKDEVIYQ